MALTSVDDAAWASPWRRRRVGEKALLSLGLVLTALLAPPWPGTVLVSLVAIAAMLGPARIQPMVLATVMLAPLAFLLVGALSVAVGIGSTAPESALLWRWGPFSLGLDGLRRAAELLGHGIAGALALMVLATTTPMVDLLDWGRRWHIPDPLLEVASLTYRLLWVLLASTMAIRAAQRARLADSAPLRRRFEAAASATGAVLVRSWERARRLEDGLAGRGHESTLATLPLERQPSPAFLLATLTTLAGIWALALTVGGHR
ncbi:cobalt ECF transporter T component CbiQ [Luteococcus sp. Sow4_B9]|uniref:cobalt ECF transporter T component CbiQ n=1 Tax=Luteococcus sp. Sow4_B9 TaxID=3438792 RepID=UPI003F99D1E6